MQVIQSSESSDPVRSGDALPCVSAACGPPSGVSCCSVSSKSCSAKLEVLALGEEDTEGTRKIAMTRDFH